MLEVFLIVEGELGRMARRLGYPFCQGFGQYGMGDVPPLPTVPNRSQSSQSSESSQSSQTFGVRAGAPGAAYLPDVFDDWGMIEKNR